MITSRVLPLALTVVLAAATGARADGPEFPVFMSGNILLETCEAPSGVHVCLGYVEGVADMLGAVQSMYVHWQTSSGAMAPQPLLSRSSCRPAEVTSGQVKDVVIRYLKDHPERRHFAATSSVLLALQEAFPCPAMGGD